MEILLDDVFLDGLLLILFRLLPTAVHLPFIDLTQFVDEEDTLSLGRADL